MRKSLAVLTVLAVLVPAAATAAQSKARKTSGEIWVSLLHQEGGLFFADGDFKDKLLGRGAIIYRVRASAGPEQGSVLVRSPKVTIYTTKGSLTGRGQATQITQGTGDTATTVVRDGTFNLTRGTGAYRGHRLRGTFSGEFTDGVYHFTYNGTYR